jgi:hypothetical protein
MDRVFPAGADVEDRSPEETPAATGGGGATGTDTVAFGRGAAGEFLVFFFFIQFRQLRGRKRQQRREMSSLFESGQERPPPEPNG